MSTLCYRSARTNGVTNGGSANQPKDEKIMIEPKEEVGGPQTPRIELVDITEKSKGYGDQPQQYLTSSLYQAKENRDKYDEYTLLLRRKIDKEGDHVSTALEVQSPIIRRALHHILASYSHLNLVARPIVIKQPYDALFHYRKELREYAAAPERTVEEKLHMEVLITFMRKNLGPTEELYEQTIPKGLITFDLLWTLFRAEDTVVLQKEYYQECLRVVDCEKKTKDGETFFQIEAWRWGYNGNKFGPTLDRIIIPEFSSSRRISQLKVFPLKVIPEEEQEVLCSYLVKRGRIWQKYVDINHRSYSGPVWVDPIKQARSIEELIVKFESARVILDHGRHQENNYNLATALVGANGLLEPQGKAQHLSSLHFWTSLGVKNSIDSDDFRYKKGMLSNMGCYENNDDYMMTDEQALLCPARSRGFSLGSKKWSMFLVDEIQDITWQDDAFNKLEIDPQMKETIEALVAMHNSADLHFDDFVADKGKGLIFLLYGPPGAGKTLTAESIAEKCHKPLYMIGTGELGTDVDYTEPILRRIFDVAKAWDAILLLDEADLFLSKRTQNDMERNAFVTIFLRLLEYYQGILFLTTNRVEEFDPAFKSRIHLSVQYFPLDATKRSCVWQNILRQVKDCRDWDKGTYDRLGRDFDLNGREIKNLVKPALALAAFKKQPLTEAVLRLVYSINYEKSQLPRSVM